LRFQPVIGERVLHDPRETNRSFFAALQLRVRPVRALALPLLAQRRQTQRTAINPPPAGHGGCPRTDGSADPERIVRPSGLTSVTQTVCIAPQCGQAGCQGSDAGGGL
jgi:hypothetical protein